MTYCSVIYLSIGRVLIENFVKSESLAVLVLNLDRPLQTKI